MTRPGLGQLMIPKRISQTGEMKLGGVGRRQVTVYVKREGGGTA